MISVSRRLLSSTAPDSEADDRCRRAADEQPGQRLRRRPEREDARGIRTDAEERGVPERDEPAIPHQEIQRHRAEDENDDARAEVEIPGRQDRKDGQSGDDQAVEHPCRRHAWILGAKPCGLRNSTAITSRKISTRPNVRQEIPDHRVGNAEGQRDRQRAADVAHAGDRDDDQEVDQVLVGIARVDRQQVGAEAPAERGQRGSQAEAHREHQVDVDADRFRHLAIVDRRADRCAETRALDPGPDGEREDRSHAHQEHAVGGKHADADVNAAGQPAGQRDGLRERTEDIPGDRDRDENESDREQHLLEDRRGVEAPAQRALEQHPERAHHDHRDEHRREERHAEPRHRGHRQVATGHGKHAVREVDEPHQSQRDGETHREQVQNHPVGGPVERQRDQEIDELEHSGCSF